MKSYLKRLNVTTLRRIFSLMGAEKKTFLSLIYGFCAIELAVTVLNTVGIRGAINAAARADQTRFLESVALILSGYLLWWCYAPISTYVTGRISGRAICGLKTQLCGHMLRLPMRFHDRHERGMLLSVLSGDAGCISNIYEGDFFQVVRSAVGGAGGLTLMALIDWRFAIVVFLLGTLSVAISLHFSKKLERIGEEQQKKLSNTSVDFYRLIRTAKTIRLLRLQENRRARFSATAREEAGVRMRGGDLRARMESIVMLVNALSYIAILLAGAAFVRAGLSDWGTVIALLGLKDTADMLFVECGQFMAGMQKNMAGAKRVFAVLDECAEAPVYPGQTARAADGVLGMKDLTFRYDGEKPVLENLCISVGERSLTALVGRSGCGKSTVLKLLLGFYEPDAGLIYAEKNLPLREMTAYVPQEATLFRGSVYENIAFGSPAATERQVREAAVLAGADEFIVRMESGYDTQITDGGASLSGGQRQRIAIARALVKNVDILLMDEITSALDGETEALIFQTLKNLSRTKAILLVTHSGSIERYADSVIVLP